MSVEKLCSVVEHAISVLRTSSVGHRQAGDLAGASVCEVTARALEAALRNVFASPVDTIDADPDESAYLERLRAELGLGPGTARGRGAFASSELVQWLVDTLAEGREHVLALRDPAELFATDIETVVSADQWVAKVDRGPPTPRKPPKNGPPPVPTNLKRSPTK